MNRLLEGEHVLKVIFEDGIAVTKFEVAKKEEPSKKEETTQTITETTTEKIDTKEINTGDDAKTIRYLFIMLIDGIGINYAMRKRKHSN
jgi:hypothetical protein